MMYVIYNYDGSIKYKLLNEFVVQGNNNVNEIFVCIEGREPEEYSLYANFKLPNGSTTTVVSGESVEETIENIGTFEGYKIKLTSAETLVAGALQMNVIALDINDTKLVAFSTYITINESGIELSDPVIITVQEYQNLIETLGNQITRDEFDAAIEGKVSKSTSPNVLYGTNGTGNQTTYGISNSGNANTVALRDANGRMKVANPSANDDVANKNYVDNAVDTYAAYYITKNAAGDAFSTYSELASASTFYSGGVVRTPTRNDYCIVREDENHDNATTRYIYTGSGWEYQYTVNETALTQAQVDALNSGATASKINSIANKQELLIYEETPQLRNGSIGNTANQYALAFNRVQAIEGGKHHARIVYVNNDAHYYFWVLGLYTQDKVGDWSELETTVKIEPYAQTENPFIDINFDEIMGKYPTVRGYAVSFFCYDWDKTPIAKRVENVGNCLQILYNKQVVDFAKGRSTIKTRNEDVLDNVYASAKYGIYSGGVFDDRNKLFSMLVITDVHSSVTQFIHAVEYCQDIPSIDAGVSLGDIQASYFADNDGTWLTRALSITDKPFYIACGNHDIGNSDDPDLAGTKAQYVAKFITPNLSHLTVNTDKAYYAVKDTRHALYFIVLNNYDSPDTITDNKFDVWKGAECLSQEQIDWFINELGEIPADYSLIIMQHAFNWQNKRFECNFSQPDVNFEGNGGDCYAPSDNIIPRIVDAWKRKTTVSFISESLNENVPDLEIDADFTSRTESNFICYLVGHTHKDIVGYSTPFPDQLIIGFATGSLDASNNASSDLPRRSGDKTEDAITIFSLNKNKKLVNLVRVGSNITTYMVNRTMISIDYSTYIPKDVVFTDRTTFNEKMESKKTYTFETALTSLTITQFEQSENDNTPIWEFKFIAGSGFTITLPVNSVWVDGTPTFTQNKQYIILVDKGVNDTYNLHLIED